jgi:hypothetical protein
VLGWAFSLTVFAAAAVFVMQMAFVIAAEQSLIAAAQAAVDEATLPRATRATVQAAVDRRLAPTGLAVAACQVALQQNGAGVSRSIRSRPGDRLSVAISVASRDVLPRWLARWSVLNRRETVSVRADRIAH